MSKGRRRKVGKGRGPMKSAEENPELWINTAPRTAEAVRAGTPPSCALSWGPVEWYAPVDDVITTGRDLMTCAAYADLLGDLLRHDFPPETVQQMLQSLLPQALAGRRPVMGGMLGMGTTIGVLPGGSTERKAGVVLLKRGGQMGGSVTPEGARIMAQHWIETAVAARHDELVGMALGDVLGVEDEGADKIGAMLGYMGAMRSLGGRELKTFRAEEAERLRLLLGL